MSLLRYTCAACLVTFFSHLGGTQRGSEPLCVCRIRVCFSLCEALDYVFDVLIWCIYICIRFILYALNFYACKNCVKGFLLLLLLLLLLLEVVKVT